MRHLFYPLFLLALTNPQATQAQTDLLQDPNIVWVGEVFTDYRFATVLPYQKEQLYTYDWNAVAVEKLLSKPTEAGFASYPDFVDMFWQALTANWLNDYDLTAYETADLQVVADEAYRGRLTSKLDTVVIFDPASDKERIQIIRQDFNYDDLIGVRVRQVLYFDQLQQAFGYRALAFAPLLNTFTADRKPTGYTPLLWFPIQAADQPQDLWTADEITYIFETKTRENSPSSTGFRDVKGQANFPAFVETIVKKPAVQLFDTEGDYTPLEEWEVAALSGGIDTLTTFDPVSYKATVTTNKTPAVWENLVSIRLAVRWFYDTRNKQLYYEFNGLAPTVKVANDAGNVLYYKPAFYVRGRM
jgi:hypothetical protein